MVSQIDGEVRSFFSPMIYVPIHGIEFDEEGIQFVRIVGAPALEAWLSSLRDERALRIRGPHHYIVSSAIKDKGSITITLYNNKKKEMKGFES